ncbi:MAG TPA: tRNA (adenosine(37)-N6)-threonylcarbamoyltransferase complex dimerization subunit type 1 TsaB [candidate division Zixibacteria bacterium]|nr:tRNA (adenosine(37)-N6)-threonylcarbamoyltransferase complex dimerization subunit type 1 TsaB [candidate division Zixibacteria bacterium]
MSVQNILAIDTSTALLRLALAFGADRLVQVREAVPQSHGQVLLPRLGDLLAAAGLTVRDLQVVAVSVGPGSFTGLRIGLAAAKGLVVALDLPLVPVTAFEIAARRLADAPRPVYVIVPLNRDEGICCPINGPLSIGPPVIARYSALPEIVGRAAVAAIGLTIREKMPALANPDLSDRLDYDAGDLLVIAREKLDSGRPLPAAAELEPWYLQKSQAEIKFEQRKKK